MIDSAHKFISASLEAIINLSSSRKHSQLKEKCKIALELIQKVYTETKDKRKVLPFITPISITNDVDGSTDPILQQWDYLVLRLVEPLELACDTHQHQIVEHALDCFQKLLSYGYICDHTPFPVEPKDKEKSDKTYKSLIGHITSIIINCYKFSEGKYGEPVQMQIIKNFITAVTTPSCGLHGKNLINGITTVFSIQVSSSNDINRTTAKGALTHMINTIFVRMAYLSNPDPITVKGTLPLSESDIPITENVPVTLTTTQYNPDELEEDLLRKSRTIVFEDDEIEENGESKEPVAYRDGCLVFRLLCNLSKKELPENIQNDNEELKSKILALEMLLTIVEGCSGFLNKNPKFVQENMRDLCISLTRHGVSQQMKIFKLALSIFSELVLHFRTFLKTEIGVLFDVFLRILESSNTTTQQKLLVLQTFSKIIKDSQTLIDIFVNYDCDLNMTDIFARLVEQLSKISQGSAQIQNTININLPIDLTGNQKLNLLPTLATECLVVIAKSMVEWSKDLYEPPTLPAPQGQENENEDEFEKALQSEPDFKFVTGQFHQNKERKAIVERGKALFKLKPKRGIQFFIDAGLVNDTPADLARFFLNTSGLDKSKIGEYMGDAHFITVLHSYIDLFDFTGMDVDIALRNLLKNFLLPGEAAQIERVMEKFASRYFEANKDTMSFLNADAVFLLSFAIIMLATDRHNPSVKVKMTLHDFKRNLLADNSQYGFNEKMLDNIFERICAEPLKLTDDDRASAIDKTLLSPKERQHLFNQEREAMFQRAVNQMKSSQTIESSPFFTTPAGSYSAYVKPILVVTWGPLLAAFSVVLEQSTDPTLTRLCLEGFKAAIRVTSVFYEDTGRNSFIRALTQFTSLETVGLNIQEKHIEAIHALIHICKEDGNYLRDSWKLVLKNISQLEQMIVMGSGGKLDDMVDEKKISPELQAKAVKIANSIRSTDIDLIFSNSKKLRDHAILDIVQALIEVSSEELNLPLPNYFCLQKLVELAVENMHYRMRIVWKKLWSLLADHFTKAGCHENKRVAVFSIDSLKQLSMKFLELDELSNYHFQKEFLKPFEIMAKTKSRLVREYVVGILCNMVAIRAHNIKSGWKSILTVFGQQASLASEEPIVHTSFQMLTTMNNQYLHLIAPNFFGDYIQAVLTFCVLKQNTDTFTKAIDLIRTSADKLSEGKLCELADGPNDSKIFKGAITQHYEKWFSIVNSLVYAVNHTKDNTRKLALSSLFKILKAYGHLFDSQLWEMLYRQSLCKLFIKMFKPIVENDKNEDSSDWLLTTCFKTLHKLITLYTKFSSCVEFLLHEIFQILEAALLSDNETLGTFGMTAFGTLLQKNSSKFTESDWTRMISSLTTVLRKNTPHHIYSLKVPSTTLNTSPLRSHEPSSRRANKTHTTGEARQPLSVSATNAIETPSPEAKDLSRSLTEVSPKRTKTSKWNTDKIKKLIGVLRNRNYLIGMINEQIISRAYIYLNTAHISTIMESMFSCYQFAISVNSNPKVQWTLARMPDYVLSDLINLHEQESVGCYLRCLFQFYNEKNVDIEKRNKIAEQKLMITCTDCVKSYIESLRKLMYLVLPLPTILQTPRKENTTLKQDLEKTHLSPEGNTARLGDLPESNERDETPSDGSYRPPPTKEELWLKRLCLAKVSGILLILTHFYAFQNDQILSNLPSIYPLLCDLSLSDSFLVRKALRDLLLRVGSLRVGEFQYQVLDINAAIQSFSPLPSAPTTDVVDDTKASPSLELKEGQVLPTLKEVEQTTERANEGLNNSANITQIDQNDLT